MSCGDIEGGNIAAVDFASFGNPSGHCGTGTCHTPNSVQVVEDLCLGKRTCSILTGIDFWGDPCPGETKWLSVEVQCQSEQSSEVDYMQVATHLSLQISVFLLAVQLLCIYRPMASRTSQFGRMTWLSL